MQGNSPARSEWLHLKFDVIDMADRLSGESDDPVQEGDSEEALEALEAKADQFASAFGPF